MRRDSDEEADETIRKDQTICDCLSSYIKEFSCFTVHGLEAMTLLVYGILSEHTSNLMQIADSLPCWVQNSSLYKRFIRFSENRRDLRSIGLFLLEKILTLLKPLFEKEGKIKIYLIIDRHEWHYGKKVNNLLVVSIYIPSVGIGIPV